MSEGVLALLSWALSRNELGFSKESENFDLSYSLAINWEMNATFLVEFKLFSSNGEWERCHAKSSAYLKKFKWCGNWALMKPIDVTREMRNQFKIQPLHNGVKKKKKIFP